MCMHIPLCSWFWYRGWREKRARSVILLYHRSAPTLECIPAHVYMETAPWGMSQDVRNEANGEAKSTNYLDHVSNSQPVPSSRDQSWYADH